VHPLKASAERHGSEGRFGSAAPGINASQINIRTGSKNGALPPEGAVIAADYDRFTKRLPETCAGRKADPAALEYKDFTHFAAS
jgi:hypothetical protein